MCLEKAGLEVLGDGFEESKVVQRPTSEVGNEDNPQPNPEGSFRRRSAPALASPVVESEGGMWLVCESCGPVGYELDVEVGMGALCVQRGNRGLHLFGLGSMCAWNSSVLVTCTSGTGNDSCWTSDLEERRPLQTSFYASRCSSWHRRGSRRGRSSNTLDRS